MNDFYSEKILNAFTEGFSHNELNGGVMLCRRDQIFYKLSVAVVSELNVAATIELCLC